MAQRPGACALYSGAALRPSCGARDPQPMPSGSEYRRCLALRSNCQCVPLLYGTSFFWGSQLSYSLWPFPARAHAPGNLGVCTTSQNLNLLSFSLCAELLFLPSTAPAPFCLGAPPRLPPLHLFLAAPDSPIVCFQRKDLLREWRILVKKKAYVRNCHTHCSSRAPHPGLRLGWHQP